MVCDLGEAEPTAYIQKAHQFLGPPAGYRDRAAEAVRPGDPIRILVAPDTPGQRAVFDRKPGAPEKPLAHWQMGRVSALAEAAAAIVFLASDDSGFITAAARWRKPLDGCITKAFTVATPTLTGMTGRRTERPFRRGLGRPRRADGQARRSAARRGLSRA